MHLNACSFSSSVDNVYRMHGLYNNNRVQSHFSQMQRCNNKWLTSTRVTHYGAFGAIFIYSCGMCNVRLSFCLSLSLTLDMSFVIAVISCVDFFLFQIMFDCR